jgi:F0F1-type ATP synthase membrane subunit b/b'
VTLRRRIAFGAIVLVSAWSLWAWAEPKPVRHAEVEKVAAGDEEPAPINWFEFGRGSPPFIAAIVNFGILAAGFYLLGKKPIAAGLQHRRDAIAKEIEDAQRMKREAEARAKTYQAKLEKLEEEVRAVREALIRTGEAERDRLVAEAEAKAQRMRKDAEFLVLQETKQFQQDLVRDTLHAALAAAEDLLKRGVTQGDQERLAEDYLADLGGRLRGERIAEPTRPATPERSMPS